MSTLKKPSPEELSELKRIGANSVLRNYLQTALDAAKDSLVATPDNNQIRQLQGQAQTLADLLKFIS